MSKQPNAQSDPAWRSEFVTRVLLGFGLATSLVSLFADKIVGNPGSSIGYKQVLGILFGLGIFGFGVILSRARKSKRKETIRWILALYLVGCSSVIWLMAPTAGASWILAGFVGAVCTLLPRPFGLLTFTGVLVVNFSLSLIDRIKADLTGMPVTMLDIQIAIHNPAGLWDALALPHWTRHVAIVAVLLAFTGWSIAGFLAGRRFLIGVSRKRTTPIQWCRIIAIGTLAGFIVTYMNILYGAMDADHTTWHHKWVTHLAERVGVLPFIGYSYSVESRSQGDIYRDYGVPPPGDEEVQTAVQQYVHFPPKGESERELKPNIAIVLAESTFEPSRVFRIRGQWDNYLFTENDLTDALGPLRVNTKGGGTWVAEFETITGLDSRLFGYSGAYTHASLSPYIERSFTKYLQNRGYETWAFLPTTGDFYNSRPAYKSYGFEHVLDSIDLGDQSGWAPSDISMMESVLDHLDPALAEPFLSYIVLLENHGPHECEDTDARQFRAQFMDTQDPFLNCVLNEYLRRLHSTTTAIRTLIRYLSKLEMTSGRPFVLLVFGDHQPMTFTGSGEFIADFGPFRNTPDMYTTFFHIMSSTSRSVDCCSTTVPIAALPSLLSAYVANRPDEIYIGENLWLYQHCGADPIGRNFADRMTSLETHGSEDRTEDCQVAYQRAIAAYRNAGVIRLQD